MGSTLIRETGRGGGIGQNFHLPQTYPDPLTIMKPTCYVPVDFLGPGQEASHNRMGPTSHVRWILMAQRVA